MLVQVFIGQSSLIMVRATVRGSISTRPSLWKHAVVALDVAAIEEEIAAGHPVNHAGIVCYPPLHVILYRDVTVLRRGRPWQMRSALCPWQNTLR